MPSVLAIFAHPDDIEFRAAGTLLLLKQRGWEVHYCNLSNGNLGSAEMSISETALVRRKEAQASAKLLGATWHRSICSDLQVFYNDATIRRVCALVRETKPTVLLTHPTQDYMEDHTNTCRLAVTGAFARGIPNYRSTPQRPPHLEPVTIYHSMPHGLLDPMRQPVTPEAYVDTGAVHSLKRDALACHRSQKNWLDLTQGTDSYLHALDAESKTLGKHSGAFIHAEGWSRHLHLGFGDATANPLKDALGKAFRFAPQPSV
jgi:LmbE family N-acetylglucosaminyl deacetylase